MARRRPALILVICCTSLFIVNMDATIVNVAHVVVLACFLLLAGSTADRMGRRRTFRMGLVLFVTGSVSCSLAPTLQWLVAARVVQALGGSMLNPVAHLHGDELPQTSAVLSIGRLPAKVEW
ncbi:MFS transporter [Mycolicibacterium sp. P9-64]|uniref:MFS transporter n=1 Tax=Mycolicibacterium sp. P9-64 TaxID=2024612 RepID=UPI0011ED001D|nr:MFS transporter [Mycolicibacterium sp. P9-64]